MSRTKSSKALPSMLTIKLSEIGCMCGALATMYVGEKFGRRSEDSYGCIKPGFAELTFFVAL